MKKSKKLTKKALSQFYEDCLPMFEEQRQMEEELAPILEKIEKERVLNDKRERFGKGQH